MDYQSIGLKKYIGVKVIEAEPCTAEIAGKVLNRPICTENADSEGNGYLVKYPDGYLSWSPKEQFDEAYRSISWLTFGLAVEALKKGHKVARAGWNGKGMWLIYIPDDQWYCSGNTMFLDNFKGIKGCPWIGMKTADDKFVPWLASQTDVLAEDWVIIE